MAVVKVHLLSVHIIHHVSGMCLTVFRNLAVYLLNNRAEAVDTPYWDCSRPGWWGFGQPDAVIDGSAPGRRVGLGDL